MTPVQRFLRRPRSSPLWQLNFQIHLWIGLLLTLYLIMIGITGSILVFRIELERFSGQRLWPVSNGVPGVSINQVLSAVQSAYPARRVISMATPTPDDAQFVATLQGRGPRTSVLVDPQTGAITGERAAKRSWLNYVADLHTSLLAGRNGRIANGIAAILLLLINVTGLAIWWPGIKLWKRGLTVDWLRSWRRVNFDLHRAVGFWAIAIVTVWAVSGIYFGWPTEVLACVNRFSPLKSAQPPIVHVKPVFEMKKFDLSTMVASAYLLDPGTTLAGIQFPYSRRAPYEILMLRPGGKGREYTDTLYFNPWDGSYLKTWRYGVNESLGDWLIWLQVPLHFGTFWGLGVKLLWAALGLTIPLLAVTGALLYWNRVLRHLVRANRSRNASLIE